MEVPKWLTVAKNEYRIRTSKIRRIRSYFPLLAVGLLTFYVVSVAPALVALFVEDLLALVLSQAATAMMQIILFTSFIYFMIIPITDTLRQEQTAQLEIFLAAPVKPSDVLLGEFLGEMPFYAIFVTVVTSFFTAMLNSLGLDSIQTVLIIIVFILIFLCALWIGTVISAVLKTRLAKTARGKDIGRALAMIIALPLVALFYGIMYGGLLDALSNPGMNVLTTTVMSVLPSSWGAQIIIGFIQNPGNTGAVGLHTLSRLSGLLILFLTSLWIGAKTANRAYSLEPTTFIAPRAKPEGLFYRTVRRLGGGGSFGTLLASVFKDYGRRLENLSNVTYIIGILTLLNVLVIPNMSTGPDDPPIALIMTQFMFPILAVMVAGGITMQGKENLFTFRKAPSGVWRLILARLLQSWLVTIPITGVITAVITILTSQATVITLLANTGLMITIVAAYVAFALGLFLLNAPFSVKSVKLWINLMIVMFMSIGLFTASLLALATSGALSPPSGGIIHVLILLTPLSWLVATVFLYLGKRKLSKIE